MASRQYASYGIFLLTYLLNSNILKNYDRRIETPQPSSFRKTTACDEMTPAIIWELRLNIITLHIFSIYMYINEWETLSFFVIWCAATLVQNCSKSPTNQLNKKNKVV